MAAIIATATTLPRTTPSAGPSSTCPTTSPADAFTSQAPRASRPPTWPSAWREYAHLGGRPPGERKPHFPTERVPRLAERTLRGRRVAKRTTRGGAVLLLRAGSGP